MTGEPILAAGLVAGLANTMFHLVYQRVPLYLDPRAAAGDAAGVRPPAGQLALLATALAAAVAFGVGWHRELSAAVALAAILGLRRAEVATYGRDVVVRLGKYAPASACLLAWLAGALVARALGLSAAEAHQRGWDTAAGAFGGAYVLAGVAKLRESGLGWGHPDAMALMLAERASGALGGLRLALARSPLACRAVGLAGLWLELGAVAFVVPAARPWAAAVVVTFKALTWGLFGYFEPEWALAAVALGVAATGG